MNSIKWTTLKWTTLLNAFFFVGFLTFGLSQNTWSQTTSETTGETKKETAKETTKADKSVKSENKKDSKAKSNKDSNPASKNKTDDVGSKNPVVEMTTSLGKIVIELNSEKAPKTVDNFLGYVKSGFYNGTIFHRVIESFMIQGGGFTKDMTEKPTKDPIKNEANNGLSNDEGTIAMARTMEPHSASAQFFINVTNNPRLNFRSETMAGWGYTVFGKVIEGMDVVNKIKVVKTGTKGMYDDVPVEPVVIEKVMLRK